MWSQCISHVTAPAWCIRPAEALADNPDTPARNSPLCLQSWLGSLQGWFYPSGARIVDRPPRPPSHAVQ